MHKQRFMSMLGIPFLSMAKVVCLIVFLSYSTLGCGGGGGGGNGGGAPVISNLTYTPQNAVTTSISVNVSGRVNFTSDADIVSLRLTDSRGGDFTVPVSASGIRSGYVNVPSSPLALTTAEIYQFSVWLVDSAGRISNKLNGSITITTPAPVAKAGADFVATTGVSTLLDGTSSVNNSGTTTTYAWSLLQKPATSNAALSGATTAKPTFIPDINGVYTFQLTVNDGTANSQADTINITSIPVGYITLGNTQDDVSHIQGTPISIDTPYLLSYTNWAYDQYGLTYIRFSTSDNKVISWRNYNGSLKVIMVAGNNTTLSDKISLGSSKDDVIKIQGTPISIDTPYLLSYTNWAYDQDGLTYIRFSTSDNKVISWRNYNGSLKVQ